MAACGSGRGLDPASLSASSAALGAGARTVEGMISGGGWPCPLGAAE